MINFKATSRRLMPLGLLLLFSIPAAGQVPDKFTNLQVLPKDVSKQELQSTMRGFAFALNVRCNYCHAQKKEGEKPGLDYASDEKDMKQTARAMLQMVAAINRDYISKVPQTPYGPQIQVQCVTCHHGLEQPRTLNSVLADAIDRKGIDAGIALYGELRKKYYGGAQYDFGETSLNQLSESLLAQKKNREALAIMEMNFAANHPDSVWSFHMLAMAHEANGRIPDAIADYRKVLELHPDDDWAKQQIETLSKAN